MNACWMSAQRPSVYSKPKQGMRIPWEVAAVLPWFPGIPHTRHLGFALLTPETLPRPSSLPLGPRLVHLSSERSLLAVVFNSHVQNPSVFRENLSFNCSQAYFRRQSAHFHNTGFLLFFFITDEMMDELNHSAFLNVCLCQEQS